jgi:hypothetical protein
MPVSTTKNVNWLAVLRRVWNFKYFGGDPTSIGNNTACLNAGAYSGEYLTGMNFAGNGTMNMIGVDANNNVVFPASTNDAASVTVPGVNLFSGNSQFTGALTVAQINGQDQGPGMAKTVTYNVALNASIGTTAFFIADQAYTVTAINYSHKTQGTGTAVANVTHETGVQAAGAGTSLQTGTFACTTIANNTVTAGVLTATTSALTLAAGDRLSILFTGTLTTLAGVEVTVSMTPSCASETSQYFVRVNGDVATQNFFCANRDMVVTGISVMFGTAFATSTTLQITHDTTTGAPGSGSSLLAAALAVDGSGVAVNTVTSPALTATTANLTLRAGDRLSTKFSATTTGAGVIVTVYMAPIYARKEVSWQLAINAQEQVAQNFFTADHNYEVVDASCSYGTAAGGAAKIAVTIDKGTTAPGAGNVVQTDNTNAGFDLNSTTGTAQFMTPASLHLRLMSPGDRLGLAVSGAAQSIADVVITVSLRPNS